MALITIKFRRDTSSQWTSKNPILAQGEPGYEIDTQRFKIGTGAHHWNDLQYVAEEGISALEELQAHIDSLTPHPVYDDGPSLVLLYENAKV